MARRGAARSGVAWQGMGRKRQVRALLGAPFLFWNREKTSPASGPNSRMQAPPYSRNANFSADERANVGGRSTVRTDQLDGELDEIATSLNAVNANLQLLQRDDGKLRDASVELYALSPAARIAMQVKFNPRGLWATATSYVMGDLVEFAGASYVCAISHLSSSFAADHDAGYWQILVTATSAAGLSFAATATISSTTTQGAIDEVDSKLRAAATPLLSHFYGGL